MTGKNFDNSDVNDGESCSSGSVNRYTGPISVL
jgi:hypothetical protein